MPKLAILAPCSNAALLNRKRIDCSRLARSDTTLQVIGIPGAEGAEDSFFAATQSIPHMLEIVRQLQAGGVDAIVLDSLRNPGLSACRQISRIPVIGSGQAAIYLAFLLADSFSVITRSEGLAAAVRCRLQEAAFRAKTASIRSINSPLTVDTLEAYTATALEAARRAVLEDGAHALIIDGGGLNPITAQIQKTLQQEHPYLPVIDPTLAALKWAEIIADLGLTHSKRSFPFPPATETVGYHFEDALLLEDVQGTFDLEAALRVIVPSSEPGAEDPMAVTYGNASLPQVHVDAVGLARGPYSIESEVDDALASPEICRHAFEAEQAGKHAILIDCMADPGLRAAREVLSIPILGGGHTTMALACLLADQFSIITVLHQSLPEIERQIARYGLGDRATPVRAVEIHVLELDAQHERLLTEFGQEVVGAIEEDGAHFIIPGCTGMIGIYEKMLESAHAYGVPVLDQNAAMVKITEMLLSLKLSHSKVSFPFPQGLDLITRR